MGLSEEFWWFRLARIIFLIGKISSIIWGIAFTIMLWSNDKNLDIESLLLIVGFGFGPYIIVKALWPTFLYVTGLIKYEEILPLLLEDVIKVFMAEKTAK